MAIGRKQQAAVGPETVIGSGAVLEGSLELEHGLRVQGTLRGDRLTARGALLVEPDGKVLCRSIQVSEACIRGCVVGDLSASTRVQLMAGAQFRGSLRTPLLELEEGADLRSGTDAESDSHGSPLGQGEDQDRTP